MKSNIHQLCETEKMIFMFPYDELTPYLQGIRDMINLLNGGEQKENNLLIDTVIYNIRKVNKQEEL
jgi:hypothetical protein